MMRGGGGLLLLLLLGCGNQPATSATELLWLLCPCTWKAAPVPPVNAAASTASGDVGTPGCWWLLFDMVGGVLKGEEEGFEDWQHKCKNTVRLWQNLFQ